MKENVFKILNLLGVSHTLRYFKNDTIIGEIEFNGLKGSLMKMVNLLTIGKSTMKIQFTKQNLLKIF